MRRLAVATAMLFALVAPAAHASDSQRLIFQDNAAMLGSPDATAQELGASASTS